MRREQKEEPSTGQGAQASGGQQRLPSPEQPPPPGIGVAPLLPYLCFSSEMGDGSGEGGNMSKMTKLGLSLEKYLCVNQDFGRPSGRDVGEKG